MGIDGASLSSALVKRLDELLVTSIVADDCKDLAASPLADSNMYLPPARKTGS